MLADELAGAIPVAAVPAPPGLAGHKALVAALIRTVTWFYEAYRRCRGRRLVNDYLRMPRWWLLTARWLVTASAAPNAMLGDITTSIQC